MQYGQRQSQILWSYSYARCCSVTPVKHWLWQNQHSVPLMRKTSRCCCDWGEKSQRKCWWRRTTKLVLQPVFMLKNWWSRLVAGSLYVFSKLNLFSILKRNPARWLAARLVRNNHTIQNVVHVRMSWPDTGLHRVSFSLFVFQIMIFCFSLWCSCSTEHMHVQGGLYWLPQWLQELKPVCSE